MEEMKMLNKSTMLSTTWNNQNLPRQGVYNCQEIRDKKLGLIRKKGGLGQSVYSLDIVIGLRQPLTVS